MKILHIIPELNKGGKSKSENQNENENEAANTMSKLR